MRLIRQGGCRLQLRRHRVPTATEPQGVTSHVYSVCYFGLGFMVPDVTLIDASSDLEAVELARVSRSFTTREVWDRHRLVALIPPSSDY